MIQRRIDKKQREIKPHKQSLREVEDHLTVLEALQCALSLITDEEELREIIAVSKYKKEDSSQMLLDRRFGQ